MISKQIVQHICCGTLLCMVPAIAVAEVAQLFGDHPAKTFPVEQQESQAIDGYTVRDIALLRGNSLSTPQMPGRTVSSPLGRITLFSSRTLEPHVASDPARIIVSAFGHAQRILQSNDFPSFLSAAEYDWQIFVESTRLRDFLKGTLSSARCHAAWMGPPANIFIAADRLASNCGTFYRSAEEVAEDLHEIMVHEIGHALEFQLMGRGFGRRQRWHSEGFASWFESLSDGSSNTFTHAEMFRKAQKSFNADWRPVHFKGSKADYVRSFAMIAALAERNSIPVLLKVYEVMDKQNCSFDQAVEQTVGWDMERWVHETLTYLGTGGYGSGNYPG